MDLNNTNEFENEDTVRAAENDIPEGSDGFVMPDTYTMPEGSVEDSEIVDRDFWKGITLPDMDTAVKKRKRSVKSVLVTVFSSLMFIGIGFGIACVSARGKGMISNLVTGGKHMTFSMPISSRPDDDPLETDSQGRYTAEGIAEKCAPSVVSLDIYGDASDFVPVGQGSGIIISEDGYIVSNAHVVDKGTKAIKVILSDGSEYAAEKIGSDPKTDIAVIKIPAFDLEAAVFCDSEDIKLGEEVVAIGSPAGYRHSVTKGIVSGLNRRIMPENSGMPINCIQIDAPVNPGNSGGALFNMWGQVIGITSSKLASIDYEGIGFAITTNDARAVIEQLMETGKVTGRARVGITFYRVTELTAELAGVKPGISINSIEPESDAANSKLQIGDIITSIDGKSVSEMDDVSAYIRTKNPGDTVDCHVYRPASGDAPEEEYDVTFKLMSDNGSLIDKE